MHGRIRVLRGLFPFLLLTAAGVGSAQTINPGLILGGFGEPNLPSTDAGGGSLTGSISMWTVATGGSMDTFTIAAYDDGGLLVPQANVSIASWLNVYAVTPGTAITPSFIATQTPIVSNYYPISFASLAPAFSGDTFDIAYWHDDTNYALYHTGPNTLDDPTANAVVPGSQIGWAELTVTDTGIVLDASAADLSGNGIIAGSYSSIPEPSTYAAIIGTAALGFAVNRRKRATV